MEGRMSIGSIWLGGCSGCHMSFLDLDERLFQLLERADIVFSPLSDRRELPDALDVLLVEGAVALSGQAELLRDFRSRTRTVVAFGDCAVVGNVTAMRNHLDLTSMLRHTYGAEGARMGHDPAHHLPAMLDEVLPLHRVIDIDIFLPGCPPPADLIWYTVHELLEGRHPVIDEKRLRYG